MLLLFILYFSPFACAVKDYNISSFVNLVNSKATESFTLSNGDVVKCVRIKDQPSLLAKKGPIQMQPSVDPHITNRLSSLNQLFSQEYGSCRKGEVPIHIPRVPEPGQTQKLMKKNIQSPEMNFKMHEHAGLYTTGKFSGFTSTMNIWNPYVETNSEFSLSQLWIISSRTREGIPNNTIEAGWQIYPDLYGGYGPRLFVYWTADGYKSTGCYNLGCNGFVQVNNRVVLGGAISKLYSSPGSTQVEVEFLVFQCNETKNWWLRVNGTYVGYWRASSLPDFANAAREVACGGEVLNTRFNTARHTRTEMGSGRFPNAGFRYAAYHRRIGIITPDYNLEQATNFGKWIVEAPDYYNVGNPQYTNGNWGSYFFFGGPGYT